MAVVMHKLTYFQALKKSNLAVVTQENKAGLTSVKAADI
jgi:hypothetical protein